MSLLQACHKGSVKKPEDFKNAKVRPFFFFLDAKFLCVFVSDNQFFALDIAKHDSTASC